MQLSKVNKTKYFYLEPDSFAGNSAVLCTVYSLQITVYSVTTHLQFLYKFSSGSYVYTVQCTIHI